MHEHTAAELIYERTDNEKPYVGMTNFKVDYVTIDDVKIAKKYLSEIEFQRLNLLVSQFLDFAELQALEQRTMKMNDWVEELDNQILLNRRKILEGNGKISHEEAIKKADGVLFICADHGNAEKMIDYETGEPHTAHTTNPVPFVLVNYDEAYTLREGGRLADIAPTLLEIMGLPQPAEMTGESLLLKK